MAKLGPIIYVEDDLDDQELFSDAITELKMANELKLIANGYEALSYLRTTTDQPFVIFCDINLPQINGIELRNEINSDAALRDKSIPFVFFTTSANKQTIKQAYLMNVQGFFVKPQNFLELRMTIQEVLEYWSKCKHPNSTDD